MNTQQRVCVCVLEVARLPVWKLYNQAGLAVHKFEEVLRVGDNQPLQGSQVPQWYIIKRTLINKNEAVI